MRVAAEPVAAEPVAAVRGRPPTAHERRTAFLQLFAARHVFVVDTGDGTARVRGTFDRIRVWEYDAPPGPSNSVMDALAKVDALTALHALED